MSPRPALLGCRRDSFLVFVSQAAPMGTIGGLVGADEICQTEAMSAGHQGLFRAWISAAGESPATRFSKSTKPYVRADKTEVAKDFAALLASGPAVPINYDAAGNVLASALPCNDDLVWTGTMANGTAYTKQDCDGWISNMNSTGAAGSFSTAGEMIGKWTACLVTVCATEAHLYCVEQPVP